MDGRQRRDPRSTYCEHSDLEMIKEGCVLIGKLPQNLTADVETLEAKARGLLPAAGNIFNSTPPLKEIVPGMYEGSGRRMIESPDPHTSEQNILREVLSQVENSSPRLDDQVLPEAEHIVRVGDPTFVLASPNEICQWQVPHRDGLDEDAAAVLIALSRDGARFLFWGFVGENDFPRRVDAKMVHINAGEFVFFSHRQVHSGGAYAGFNARLYWSFQTSSTLETASQTVPVPMAATADIEESDEGSILEEVSITKLPSMS